MKSYFAKDAGQPFASHYFGPTTSTYLVFTQQSTGNQNVGLILP